MRNFWSLVLLSLAAVISLGCDPASSQSVAEENKPAVKPVPVNSPAGKKVRVRTPRPAVGTPKAAPKAPARGDL